MQKPPVGAADSRVCRLTRAHHSGPRAGRGGESPLRSSDPKAQQRGHVGRQEGPSERDGDREPEQAVNPTLANCLSFPICALRISVAPPSTHHVTLGKHLTPWHPCLYTKVVRGCMCGLRRGAGIGVQYHYLDYREPGCRRGARCVPGWGRQGDGVVARPWALPWAHRLVGRQTSIYGVQGRQRGGLCVDPWALE